AGYDHASVDINQVARVTLIIAQLPVLRLGVPLSPEAVAEWFGAWLDHSITGMIIFGDAVETVTDDLTFGTELCLIAHLLKVTAAAHAEIRAGRLDAVVARFDDCL